MYFTARWKAGRFFCYMLNFKITDNHDYWISKGQYRKAASRESAG